MTQQPKNPKTIFFGTPRFAQIILEKLVNSPFKPQLVITAPDTKVGRGRKLQASPVKQTAVKNRIEVLQPKSLSDPNLKLKIENFKFDLAILVAYGKIITADVLSIPKYGFINIHPSLLPKYRGPSPIQTAILDSAEKTGVTIMLLDEKIDHGPILAQKEIAIEKDDTHASLIEKLGKLGADLLIEILPYHASGDIKPKPQDHSKATYTKQIKKTDGYIDLNNPPDPVTFDRMIRAFYPWPGVWSKLMVNKQSLRSSSANWRTAGLGKWLMVKFLPGNLIQLEGKRPLSVQEFKNGYPQAFEQINQLLGNGD